MSLEFHMKRIILNFQREKHDYILPPLHRPVLFLFMTSPGKGPSTTPDN